MEAYEVQEEFLKIANRFGKMKYEAMFRCISRREYEMLSVIGRFMETNTGKKGIYVSKLANLLRVSSPAVSRMVGALEEKGYIGRDVDKEDRRNTYVYLTKSGEETKEAVERSMRELMKAVIARMGEQNMQELIRLWNQLADIMEEEMKKRND